MLNDVELEPRSEIVLHSYPHEKLGVILENGLIFTVDGTDHHLTAVHRIQVQGGVLYSARSGNTVCKALDIFTPILDDY